MRVELRRRVHPNHMDVHHDVVLQVETEDESLMLDKAFGDKPDKDGLIATGVAEVRLSDGIGAHYVLLRPVTE